MLAPQQCYDAAIIDGTYTVLLMEICLVHSMNGFCLHVVHPSHYPNQSRHVQQILQIRASIQRLTPSSSSSAFVSFCTISSCGRHTPAVGGDWVM